MIYVIAFVALFLGYVSGYSVCSHNARKAEKKLIAKHTAALYETFSEAHQAGWHSALNDSISVRASYRKIFGPEPK